MFILVLVLCNLWSLSKSFLRSSCHHARGASTYIPASRGYSASRALTPRECGVTTRRRMQRYGGNMRMGTAETTKVVSSREALEEVCDVESWRKVHD